MNEREQKIYKALQDPDVKEKVLERLFKNSVFLERAYARKDAIDGDREKYLVTEMELSGDGKLRIAVGFKGNLFYDYDVRVYFGAESVWSLCKDLFQTKADKYDDFVANGVDAIHTLYANAIPDAHGTEKRMLDKNKKDAVNVLAKLACIARKHLDEWEE